MADFDIGALFADPNFRNLLAGIGTGLDPKGVGGAIGIPTQQYNQSVASQKSIADIIAKLGQPTAANIPGLTSAKLDDKGVKLDIATPQFTQNAPGGGATTTTPQGFQPTPGQGQVGGVSSIKELLPFLQALQA